MPRIARAVLPDVPHHITQRGVRRSNVFFDSADYETYRDLIQESSRQYGLRICAYCLMTNHVHIVAVPERPDSIANTFQRCHGMYARRFNKKYGVTGHTWQARPFSCTLDEAHFWAAVRYVERNPVRAGMAYRAEDYSWSSAQAHCGLVSDDLLDGGWPPEGVIQDWSRWLGEGYDVRMERSIRDRTFTGRPCGDDDFVRRVEVALDRQLSPKKPGPKPHPTENDNGRLLGNL
jgi:putative transposase